MKKLLSLLSTCLILPGFALAQTYTITIPPITVTVQPGTAASTPPPTPTPVVTPTPTPVVVGQNPCASGQKWTTLTVKPTDNITAALACAAPGFKLTLAAGDYHQRIGVPPGLDGFDIAGSGAGVTKVHMLGCTTAANGSDSTCAERLYFGKGVIHLQSSGTIHDLEVADGGSANVGQHDLQAGIYIEANAAGPIVARHIMFRNNQNGMASNLDNTGAEITIEDSDFVGNSTDGGSHSSYLGGGKSVTYNNIHDYGSRWGNDQKSRVPVVNVNGGFFRSIQGRWVEAAAGAQLTIKGGTFVGSTCCQNVFGNGDESANAKFPVSTTWTDSAIWLGRASAFWNVGPFTASNITLTCGTGGSAFNPAANMPLTGLPACPATAAAPPADPPYVSGAK